MVVQRSELSRAAVDHYFITQKEVPHFGEMHPQISKFDQRAPQTNGGFWGGSSPESHWICPSFWCWGLDSGHCCPRCWKNQEREKKMGGKSGGQIWSFWTCLIFPWFCFGVFILLFEALLLHWGHTVMDATTTEVAFSDPHGIYFILA